MPCPLKISTDNMANFRQVADDNMKREVGFEKVYLTLRFGHIRLRSELKSLQKHTEAAGAPMRRSADVKRNLTKASGL